MSFIASLFGAASLQKEGDALDAKLAEMNAKDYGPGGKFYTPQNWAVAQQNLSTGATGNVSTQIDAAFDEGLNDGAKNVTGFLGGIFDVIGKGLGAVLKSLPWWLWASALLYLLLVTGILPRLLGKVAR